MIDIKEQVPDRYMECVVRTNWDNFYDVIYDDQCGIFYLEETDDEIGWIDNGEQPELVTHWEERE